MGIIREAAADFPGLGLLIYDYKFRMKAAAPGIRMYQMLFQMLTRLFLTKDPHTTKLCTQGTLKRAIATTEARNAIETPASLPMCVTDITGVTLGSTAELNPPSATNVAIYTQEAIVQQARPNQITPPPPTPGKQRREITTSLQMIKMIFMYTKMMFVINTFVKFTPPQSM